MATLTGTVPRMVRPAPGQNYPRTGFPLEGKFALLNKINTLLFTSYSSYTSCINILCRNVVVGYN